MKLYVWTESNWSNEDNEFAGDNLIEIDWDFPTSTKKRRYYYFYLFTHKNNPFDCVI